MKKETARIALEFLGRVDLKGTEAQAFNQAAGEIAKFLEEEKPKK